MEARLPLATLVALGPQLATRVRVALMPPGELRTAPSWASLRDTAEHELPDLAVLDPDECRVGAAQAAAWPGAVPVVLYLRLAPASSRRAVEWARIRAADVVIYGHGDDPGALRARLYDAACSRHGRELYARVAERLAGCSPSVREGIEAMCLTPHRAETPFSLAARCGIGVRELAHQLRCVGIPSVARLVLAAQVAAMIPWIYQTHLSLRAIARRSGVGSVRTLRHRVRALTGISLEEAREGVGEHLLLDLLVAPLTGATPSCGDRR